LVLILDATIERHRPRRRSRSAPPLARQSAKARESIDHTISIIRRFRSTAQLRSPPILIDRTISIPADPDQPLDLDHQTI
jgi:hypothetical protein